MGRGYTAGAGVEHKFTPNWSVRAEYRYLHFDVDRSVSRFDSQTQVAGTTTSTNVNQFNRNLSTSFDSHIGKIALVYAPWAPVSMPTRRRCRSRPGPVVTDSWAGLYFGAAYGAGADSARTSFSDTQTQTFRQTVPGTTVTRCSPMRVRAA